MGQLQSHARTRSGLLAPTTAQPPRLAELSVAFLLDQVAGSVGGLPPRDALLVLAINQANIAPLTRDPAARSLYGGLEAPAPDDQRRAVSISAVASSLRLPFETVRRHIRRLHAEGVCVLSERGVIVPESFLASPAYLISVQAAHARLRAFYEDLQAAGLLGALPASAYAVGEGAPVRAAVRLLSDYILRTSENLMTRVGDVLSVLILLNVLDASLPAPGEAVSVAAVARRLSIPMETVRRHAQALIEQGHCARVHGGLIVPEELLEGPGLRAFFRDDTANVQRLFAGLAERGVIEAWEQAG